jgi:hypothetical protein
MHRTNVYLTAEEEAALDARARAEGVTRSKVLRDIVDQALGLGGAQDDEAVNTLLRHRAGEIAEQARRLSRRDPDLRTG